MWPPAPDDKPRAPNGPPAERCIQRSPADPNGMRLRPQPADWGVAACLPKLRMRVRFPPSAAHVAPRKRLAAGSG